MSALWPPGDSGRRTADVSDVPRRVRALSRRRLRSFRRSAAGPSGAREVELVIAILIPAPLALLFWTTVFTAGAGFLALALPFTALAAFMIHRAAFRKRHFARVVGRWGAIEIRFDRPGWKRKQFHSELLRRAGLRDAPIP